MAVAGQDRACSIIAHVESWILASGASSGSAEHPTTQRNTCECTGHPLFPVNPDTYLGAKEKGMNHPQETYLFCSSLFFFWGLVLVLIFFF